MSNRFSLIILITAFIISFVLLQIFFGNAKATNFEELALGHETSSFFYRYKDHPINISELDSLDKYVEGWKSRGSRNIILWLGNSQLHGINQYKGGDNTSTGYFYKHLMNADYDLLSFSIPNANLQEHYLLFEYLKNILPVKKLIIGVCFDDLRENNIRDNLIPIIKKNRIRNLLILTATGKSIVNVDLTNPGNDDLAALNETIQKYSERSLNNWLNDNWYLWNIRPEIRGQLFNDLYMLRNTVLNINPTSKRKMIKSNYNNNIEALKDIYLSAKESNIEVFTYILPIRQDVKIPYDLNEYKSFKIYLASLNVAQKDHLFNFENIIPSKYWGSKDATMFGKKDELDFMHFQAAAHKILSDSLWNNINGYLKNN
ncbi:MAG TPA: hypothetical protein VKA26_07595 [Ignavibacteriaceae bacterium]|nr:hypothetical protein [Ignavibacteriaceae bacterium]